MKQTSIVLKSMHNEPQIDNFLRKKDAELKALAQKTARQYAEKNLPAVLGDSLVPYTEEIKSGYERTAAEVLLLIQPETHFPEGKLDINRGKEQEGDLKWQIEQREEQNEKDSSKLNNFDPKAGNTWIKRVVIVFAIIMLGEILFNTKAFQVIGENLLSALVLSIGTTVAVFVFGEVTALVHKICRTKLQRICTVVISLLIMSCVFYGLAMLRAEYLASHEIQIRPAVFVMINLFFFIVSGLVAFFFLPSLHEMKEHLEMLKLYRPLERRKRETDELKAKREDLKNHLHEITKARVRSLHYAQYAQKTISKMYREAVGIFMRVNINYRLDHKIPDCFSLELAEPDFGETDFKSLNGKY